MDALKPVLCLAHESCSKNEQQPGRSTRGLAGWREILFPTQALTWSGSTGSGIYRSQPSNKAPRQERGQSRPWRGQIANGGAFSV